MMLRPTRSDLLRTDKAKLQNCYFDNNLTQRFQNDLL